MNLLALAYINRLAPYKAWTENGRQAFRSRLFIRWFNNYAGRDAFVLQTVGANMTSRLSAVRRTRCASCDRPGRVEMVGQIRKTSRVPRTRLRGTREMLAFHSTISTIPTPPSSFIQSQMDIEYKASIFQYKASVAD